MHCVPSAVEAAREESPPPGRWWVVSPAPAGGRYWLAPDDLPAREWAAWAGVKYLERSGRHLSVDGTHG